MNQPAVEFDDVTCSFVSDDNKHYTAVRDVNLTIGDGEFVSVVGPTGCGKSTVLNMAAGLLTPSKGTVKVFGEELVGLNKRAGYMFQAEALMPWRTAIDNVSAGLQFKGVLEKERHEQARHWLSRVGLSGFEDRYPHELSGGMRKRVALAQTLIMDPDIILMDEPVLRFGYSDPPADGKRSAGSVVAEEKGRALYYARLRRSYFDFRPRGGFLRRPGFSSDR